MFSAFGAAALLLASVGVYGVLSYSVSQRTQEIGVRVALGAGRRDVMRLVLGQGLRLAAIGIAVGLVGALGVTRYIRTLLYNVTPTDPVSFTFVAVFLVARRRRGELRAGAPRDGGRSDHRAQKRVAEFDRSAPRRFQLPSLPEIPMQLVLPFIGHQDHASRDLAPPVVDQPHPVIEFVRVRRARRYILRVRPDGTLRVTVPNGGSRREAEQFVRKNQRWIRRERDRVQVERAPREWSDGTRDPAARRTGSHRRRDARRRSRRVLRRADADRAASLDVRAAVERDLRELARFELIPRLHELAATHDLQPGLVSVRNQRSRWGSCARNGNIALNFRLVQMPAAVRDYVLLHELMHIRQQNHSRRFWKLVEAVCPDFRDAERWLRTIGKTLF